MAATNLKLIGATLLHTRCGHWQHPKSKRFFIRPAEDKLKGYPGLAEKLLLIHQRALAGEQTPEDGQTIQWLAQACMGTLDIYQQNVSLFPVGREEILEEIEDWLATNDVLATNLFIKPPFP